MEMIGGGKMHVYPPQDEGPHQPGPEENWQESVVLIWWDAKQSVGGYCRVGHEPNRNGGEAAIWAAVHVPGESFYRRSSAPLTQQDRIENGFGAGNGALTFRFDAQCNWVMKEPDLDLQLRLEDFHPAIDGYRKDGGGDSKIAEIGSQHVEVACRVTGRLTVKNKRYDIDGLGMRDHGWGARDWSVVRAHRWTVGAFDRDNSFCAVAMHLSSDRIVKFAWVVRGDKVIYADKVDIVSYIACDGASNVGGRTRMTLSTGEKFEVHLQPLAPATLFYHQALCCVDTLSRLTWGDKVGLGVFETSSNLQAGTRVPEVLDGGIATNGWHKHDFTPEFA